MRLHAAEKLCALVTGGLFLVDIAIAAARQSGIDIAGYAVMVAIGLAAVGVGQFYRTVRPNERIAAAATATGLFILFTLAASIFNYLLLPIGDRRIDGLLTEIDALVGYRWAEVVGVASQYPAISLALRAVYMSSLLQVIVVIVFLGFSNRLADLHLFLLTGIAAALATIGIWAAIPSSGPSAYQALPGEIAARASILVDPAYGAELNRLVLEGPRLISPKDGLGLIAFPSFHTVMACLSVWFMVPFRRIFPLVASVNVVMLPAILVHGGHHLVDIAAGIAVFSIALVAAKALLATPRFALLKGAPFDRRHEPGTSRPDIARAPSR